MSQINDTRRPTTDIFLHDEIASDDSLDYTRILHAVVASNSQHPTAIRSARWSPTKIQEMILK
jgi:hypothetical protein